MWILEFPLWKKLPDLAHKNELSMGWYGISDLKKKILPTNITIVLSMYLVLSVCLHPKDVLVYWAYSFIRELRVEQQTLIIFWPAWSGNVYEIRIYNSNFNFACVINLNNILLEKVAKSTKIN